MRTLTCLVGSCLPLLAAATASAATISVAPSDSYQKIESAKAGDEVVIAPGTYQFRVHLTAKGTADQPIVIRALDPAQPPVWDLADTLVEDAPGSYTAGDRGRGCWQISGGQYYDISGIVLTNCHNASHNAAGIRYYNGARGIRLRDCVFRDNDNGLTGGTQDSEIVVEYCEFGGNGNPAASAPTHNLYIYGGTFTLRYSYVHDPIQGQNFHIRAANSVIEYNWFARAKSYEGDLMSDDDLSGTSAVRQVMLLRGNVFLQAAQPNNNSQVIAVYNDGEVDGLSFSLRLVNNTFVGNGGRAALVHLSNADGTTMWAELVNNIVAGTSVVTLVEDDAQGHVSGNNNWIVTGASADGLSASIAGGDPGFANPGAKDFTLAAGSGAIGKAAAADDLPSAEYYRDEQVARLRRVRATAADLGAFESTTTSAPTGPYGQGAPVLDAGPDTAAIDAPAIDAPVTDAPVSGGGGSTGRRDGAIATGGATGTGGISAGLDAAGPDGGRGTGGSGAGGSGGSRPVVLDGGPEFDVRPVASGGAPAGGATAAGGATGAGGAHATAGASGTSALGGTTGRPQSGGSSGCSCGLGGSAAAAPWWLLGLFALGWLSRRRR
jgi:MYXO-CTERM domain-containing protein